MDAKAKTQKLGKVILDFKRHLEDLQELVNLGTTPKKFVEHKVTIEDAVTRLEDSEKEANLITHVNVQFWGSVV